MKNNYSAKKCIMVCAGELDVRKTDIITEDADILIAVDGGLAYCRQLSLKPDVIIGDFDSASEEDRAYIQDIKDTGTSKNASGDEADCDNAGTSIFELPKEKDDTDTIAAIRKGLELGCTLFYIYGATGGRIDHYFANIQALLFIKHHGAEGRLIGNGCELFVIENETVDLGCKQTGTVSLFVLGDRAQGVTIDGLYYEVKDVELTNDYPIGISNEFCGKNAIVTVDNGALICMVGEALR